MARQGHLAMLVAFGALLAGCGGQAGAGAEDPGSLRDGPEAARPLAPEELIGSWTLVDVDEPGAGTILHLAHPDLHVLGSRCGTLSGSWRADSDGVFLAEVNSASAVEGVPGCERASQDTPDWLRRVTAYRFDDGGRPVLLDDLAQPVARLVPGASPTPGPEMAASVLEPPVVTDEVRRALAPAVALPATLTPADQHRLVGRWAPVSGHRNAYLRFTADGDWAGSDGCNDAGGRWISGAGGTLLATTGATTLVGCDASVPVGSWLWVARRAGFDGEVLVLLDAEGKETGRLHSAG
ncbi:META domain-containing protein [Micromonospora echinospora]|uniref:META domain-containing protein n=1 Tax=Micromonospora echinospora TaxID=1877 RepID=UPI0033F72EFF